MNIYIATHGTHFFYHHPLNATTARLSLSQNTHAFPTQERDNDAPRWRRNGGSHGGLGKSCDLRRLIHLVHAQLILTNLSKMPVIHQKTDQLLTSIIQHLHVRFGDWGNGSTNCNACFCMTIFSENFGAMISSRRKMPSVWDSVANHKRQKW